MTCCGSREGVSDGACGCQPCGCSCQSKGMDWGQQGFKIRQDDTFFVPAGSEFSGWKFGYVWDWVWAVKNCEPCLGLYRVAASACDPDCSDQPKCGDLTHMYAECQRAFGLSVAQCPQIDCDVGQDEEEEKEDKCGPDVTKAVLKDLEDKLKLVQQSGFDFGAEAWLVKKAGPKDNDGIPRLGYEEFQAKYGLSYKWMDLGDEECGTGDCAGTVFFAGQCIPQNELGNMALMMLAAMAFGLEKPKDMGKLFEAQLIALHLLAPMRPDSAAAYALGLELYFDVAPAVIGATATTDHPAGSFAHDIPADWLTQQMGDEGWQSMQSNLGKFARLLKTLGGGMSASDLQRTARGVDTGKCPPCGKVVDKISGNEIFSNLADEFKQYRGDGGAMGLDEWLETQVPEAIRRETAQPYFR